MIDCVRQTSEVTGGMSERNARLRAARERVPSPRVPGAHLTRPISRMR